jgi:5'-phosphate synthase pdxT subunit
MKVGILALQGDFREHKQALSRLGAEVLEVRLPAQLAGLSGVVIPGGESTTMSKLMQAYGLGEALLDFHAAGGALWGTCAGAITLASGVVGYPAQFRLGLLDASLERNAYGRQVASFETEVKVKGLTQPFHAVFIRAPRIVRLGPEVAVLASYQGDPIMVRQKRLLATVFHPELSGDDRIHRFFLEQLSGKEPASA